MSKTTVTYARDGTTHTGLPTKNDVIKWLLGNIIVVSSSGRIYRIAAWNS